jgi:hypothetical protein
VHLSFVRHELRAQTTVLEFHAACSCTRRVPSAIKGNSFSCWIVAWAGDLVVDLAHMGAALAAGVRPDADHTPHTTALP